MRARMHEGERSRGVAWAVCALGAVGVHALFACVVGLLPIRGPLSAPALTAVSDPLSAEIEVSASEALPVPAAVSTAPPSRVPAGPPQRSAIGRAISASDGGAVARAPREPARQARTIETESVPAQRGLSRDELGIGPRNPFVRQPGREGAGRGAAVEQFQKRMADDLLRSERAVGLGPEGPVITALELATRSDNPAPNSSALMRFSTDADGRLLSAELLQSTSDPTPWRRIARRVVAKLGSQRLRIPKTGRGVTFDVRVTSRIQLPSGADPGLAVNVLGIPVKKGDGPRSARIDILNLKPSFLTEEITLPSGDKERVPALGFGSILMLTKDPADIGAKPRRMVRAHVVRLSTNARDASPE